VLTDFDGTLAPIVDDPATSAPLPGAADVLHLLAGRYAVVAVISGRPASFLAGALDIGSGRSSLQAFGLYGAEHVDQHGQVVVEPSMNRWVPAISAAADELRATVPHGVVVEVKEIATTVHWRGVPDHEHEARDLAAAVAQRHGLEARAGRKAAELIAPDAPDKAVPVRRLVSGADAACFLGDDSGDLPAFRALADLGSSTRLRAVRVAIASRESPPTLLAEADVVLDDPAAALEFLRLLAAGALHEPLQRRPAPS
jgi:trehalose 6-phosphate phosphatase